MKKLSTLTWLLFICSTLTSLAAFGQGRNTALRQEVQAYTQENILPVLQMQRLKLEQQLSPQDKQTIQRLRQEMATARAAGKQLQATRRQQQKGNRSTRSEAGKAQLKALREKRKQVYHATAALAQKYNAYFEQLQTEIAADKAQWDTHLKAIWAKHQPEAATGKPGIRHRQAHRLTEFRHLMRPTRFILWEVEAPATDAIPVTAVYPNPATSTNTISYYVPASGKVNVTLLNENGKVIRTLVQEQLTAGTYTYELDVRALPNATYYYKIETATGSETKRFLKR